MTPTNTVPVEPTEEMRKVMASYFERAKAGECFLFSDMWKEVLAAAPQHPFVGDELDVDTLAQEIRRVDGNHTLGAGALAEALMPFLSAHRAKAQPAQQQGEPVGEVRMRNGEWFGYITKANAKKFKLECGDKLYTTSPSFEQARRMAADEYGDWIKFHDAGNGDFADFMRSRAMEGK
jgi:hypothetical protein